MRAELSKWGHGLSPKSAATVVKRDSKTLGYRMPLESEAISNRQPSIAVPLTCRFVA
jgi:hypothetical protein